MAKLNKLQIETIERTLCTKVKDFYTARAEKTEKGLKPDPKSKKLFQKMEALHKEYIKYKEEKEHNGKFEKIVSIPYSGTVKPDWKVTNYAHVSLQTEKGYRPSFAVLPEDKEHVLKAKSKIEDYILKLTLGEETLGDLDAFAESLCTK